MQRLQTSLLETVDECNHLVWVEDGLVEEHEEEVEYRWICSLLLDECGDVCTEAVSAESQDVPASHEACMCV